MIILNLNQESISVEEFSEVGEHLTIVSPLVGKPELASLTLIDMQLTSVLEQIKSSPKFNITDNILCVCEPSLTSLALLIGVKAAFPNVKIWFRGNKLSKPLYIDLSMLEVTGLDWAMRNNQKEVV